jgi:hypothetical protein
MAGKVSDKLEISSRTRGYSLVLLLYIAVAVPRCIVEF